MLLSRMTCLPRRFYFPTLFKATAQAAPGAARRYNVAHDASPRAVATSVEAAEKFRRDTCFSHFSDFSGKAVFDIRWVPAWHGRWEVNSRRQWSHSCFLPLFKRDLSSSADGKTESVTKELLKTINNEIQHEKSNYQPDAEHKKFLQNSGWTLLENENDMMVTLRRDIGGKRVVVEFSCVQNAESPAEEGVASEMSDFTVTVTNAKSEDGEGLTFYCSTTHDEEEKFRYCIGQVRLFKNAEEKESLSAYPGPYFEDLDDSFQQNLDEWLSQMGVDNELCDFIDKFSVDKESREYLAWLKKLSNFISK